LDSDFRQPESALLDGQVMGVAYSGFREGQHPDRGQGAANPSDAEILEDLRLLADHGFRLIRLYDARENSATVLSLIREHRLPLTVLLGVWLDAEVSNHAGCPWLHQPIPKAQLVENRLANDSEVLRGVGLANEFSDIVVAVNVGNEALVDWNDHMVSLQRMIEHVREVRSQIAQPVTVAENYAWWIHHGAPLAAELDFVGVHTYPAWEHKSIDEALAYTVENIEAVRGALPDSPLAILEGGWATTAVEFGAAANEANQARHYEEVARWAEWARITYLFFEAFDEPWKGDPESPQGAEKHWGLFRVDRSPKQAALMLKRA
jgi:exo-beta-1,3-glucanase (GH17 family)